MDLPFAADDIRALDGALCYRVGDPADWWPESSNDYQSGRVAEAIKTCGLCDVRLKCLEIALRDDIRYGIWGATTPEMRAAMKDGAA